MNANFRNDRALKLNPSMAFGTSNLQLKNLAFYELIELYRGRRVLTEFKKSVKLSSRRQLLQKSRNNKKWEPLASIFIHVNGTKSRRKGWKAIKKEHDTFREKEEWKEAMMIILPGGGKEGWENTSKERRGKGRKGKK